MDNRKRAELEGMAERATEEQLVRQAKVDAIEGLAEIKAALKDLAAWNREFQRSFEDGCGGLGVRPRPKYDIPAMKAKYPRAAAFLNAESVANKRNFELSAIGRKALNRIIDDEDYLEAINDMEAERRAFAEAHAWD